MNVAIIGAGAAGLTAGRECLNQGLSFRIFESLGRVGGTWCLDKHEDSPIYDGLRTNLPRALMRFQGVDWDKEVSNDYTTPRQVDAYISKYARQIDIEKHISFNTTVTSCSPIVNDKKWKVLSKTSNSSPSSSSSDASFLFDAVIVANGHFNVPRVPANFISSLANWQGDWIHSKEYKRPDKYRGKVVCVVGAQSSGRDIGRELDGVAKEIHICDSKFSSITNEQQQQQKQKQHVPNTVNTWWRPRLKSLVANTRDVKLESGDLISGVDSIIFCTGYTFAYDFLGQFKELVTEQGKRVRPLYKHIMHAEHPTLFFMGLNQPINPFPLFEIQAKWILKMLQNPGGKLLPPSEKRFDEVHLLDKGEENKKKAHSLWEYNDQFEYLEALVDEACLDQDENQNEDQNLKERIEKDRRLYNMVSVLPGRKGIPGGIDFYRDIPVSSLLL